MTTTEVIQSWRWRIVRLGHTAASFCGTVQTSKAALSEYMAGKKDPSLKVYNKIESKLKELETEKGLI